MKLRKRIQWKHHLSLIHQRQAKKKKSSFNATNKPFVTKAPPRAGLLLWITALDKMP